MIITPKKIKKALRARDVVLQSAEIMKTTVIPNSKPVDLSRLFSTDTKSGDSDG